MPSSGQNLQADMQNSYHIMSSVDNSSVEESTTVAMTDASSGRPATNVGASGADIKLSADSFPEYEDIHFDVLKSYEKAAKNNPSSLY